MDHTVAATRLFLLAESLTKKNNIKNLFIIKVLKLFIIKKNISTFNLGKKCSLTLGLWQKKTSPGLWVSDYQITLTAESVFHDNKQAIDK